MSAIEMSGPSLSTVCGVGIRELTGFIEEGPLKKRGGWHPCLTLSAGVGVVSGFAATLLASYPDYIDWGESDDGTPGWQFLTAISGAASLCFLVMTGSAFLGNRKDSNEEATGFIELSERAIEVFTKAKSLSGNPTEDKESWRLQLLNAKVEEVLDRINKQYDDMRTNSCCHRSSLPHLPLQYLQETRSLVDSLSDDTDSIQAQNEGAPSFVSKWKKFQRTIRYNRINKEDVSGDAFKTPVYKQFKKRLLGRSSIFELLDLPENYSPKELADAKKKYETMLSPSQNKYSIESEELFRCMKKAFELIEEPEHRGEVLLHEAKECDMV